MLRVRLSKARAERLASERRRQAKRRSNGTSSSNKGTLGRAEVCFTYLYILYILLLCRYYCYCHDTTGIIATAAAMLISLLLLRLVVIVVLLVVLMAAAAATTLSLLLHFLSSLVDAADTANWVMLFMCDTIFICYCAPQADGLRSDLFKSSDSQKVCNLNTL
jgi:hypothetical protein